MIKLAIFDLDGTLLNTLTDLADSCNYVLRKNNFPEHETEAYRYFVGNGVSNLIKRALKNEKRTEEEEGKLVREFISYYQLHSEVKTAPYPETKELLKLLSSQNIKLAVASNKFIAATQSLCSKYFEEIDFAAVLGQREDIAVKPNPQIIYDIQKETGIHDNSEIIYIGDSGVDMQTAVNAKLTGIGVLWGFRTEDELRENGADYLAKEPKEIAEIINKINKS